MDFRSDNVSGAHPAVLEALASANRGTRSAYGEDEETRQLAHTLSEVFEREVSVFPVVTGTAANALALALYTPPWGAIYAHASAHVQVSECGAPEFFTAGAKLVPVAQDPAWGVGKIHAAGVARAIHREGAVHAVQPAAISISQASEAGTVYTPAELAELSELAQKHAMTLQMDGARFANALVASTASPAALTWKAGVDVLAFGGTKNGCLLAEAVVLFDPARAGELAFRRKRAGHLVSKMRFVSAQLNAYLQNDLWLNNARHANQQAARLAVGFARCGVPVVGEVETNQVFATLDDSQATRLRDRGAAFYDWPTLGPGVRRFVTAFDTSSESVDALLALLAH